MEGTMKNPISWIINRKVNGELQKISTAQQNSVPAQNNVKTTLFGFIFAATQAATIDWVKLYHGDGVAIGQLVGAIATGCWGFYTNRGTVGVVLTPAASDKISETAAEKAVEQIGEKLQS